LIIYFPQELLGSPGKGGDTVRNTCDVFFHDELPPFSAIIPKIRNNLTHVMLFRKFSISLSNGVFLLIIVEIVLLLMDWALFITVLRAFDSTECHLTENFSFFAF